MASAAEQLAAHINFANFAKATELKKRIWFTLGALVIYRLGTYIPLPGIDPSILQDIFSQQSGGILDIFDTFAGGAFSRMTIFALNIMPYISAMIIIQLLTAVSPHFEQLKKEGEAGRKKMNQYTRYGTVLLASLQAYGISVGLESMTGSEGTAVLDPGLFFRATTVVTLVGGTIFLMWLGEQITARGVGNGISLIIFSAERGPSAPDSSSSCWSSRLSRSRSSSSSSAPSAGSWCNTRSARSATRCSAARARTSRSSSTPPASFRRSSRARCCCCR
jgi:preprotein translocase subunit SecY